MSAEHGRSDIINIDYLAETAVIGLIVDRRPTVTTPRDNIEQARTTEGNIVDVYLFQKLTNLFWVEVNKLFWKIREYKHQSRELFDRDDKWENH